MCLACWLFFFHLLLAAFQLFVMPTHHQCEEYCLRSFWCNFQTLALPFLLGWVALRTSNETNTSLWAQFLFWHCSNSAGTVGCVHDVSGIRSITHCRLQIIVVKAWRLFLWLVNRKKKLNRKLAFGAVVNYEQILARG